MSTRATVKYESFESSHLPRLGNCSTVIGGNHTRPNATYITTAQVLAFAGLTFPGSGVINSAHYHISYFTDTAGAMREACDWPSAYSNYVDWGSKGLNPKYNAEKPRFIPSDD